MARERDVRVAVKEALEQTGQFSLVALSGLPENYGFGASALAAAVIEPLATTWADRWDGGAGTGGDATVHLLITLIVRNEDPQLRDEAVEDLLQYARNALDGQSLAGFTVPDNTKFTSWRWLEAEPPERRLAATFQYVNLVFGWESNDTTE